MGVFFLKWWVSPTTKIGFPTKNDHHLGCEMGGTTIYSETPIQKKQRFGHCSNFSHGHLLLHGRTKYLLPQVAHAAKFDGLIHELLKLTPLRNGYIIYLRFLGVITVITPFFGGVKTFIFPYGFWGPRVQDIQGGPLRTL